jgi:hypothetical protein
VWKRFETLSPPLNMKITSKHIPFVKLADLAEGRASADEQNAAHLSACSACAGELQRLGQVMELMRTDKSIDAPRDVFASALNIFRSAEPSGERSLLRRIVAALTFDSSSNMTPAFGVRSGQSAARQLLFSAGDSDIDLRISSEDDQWIVTGQLLGSECGGGRVELAGENGSAEADLNDVCEFTLPPVAAGSYTLRLRISESEIEIPQLELRA